ncbi:peroxisomal N(1)-acetyl-spermine/spermidine oxidase-like [Hydractinia symbiolongicarpus]|uniref:peroxisomal N(1)-acetyl-spermine/spermidine oxidase-like n=1 Tax=Hydractinia symbiolongicarpus TaxID=13093 RepID=UPI00254BF8D9|nr:peroxisomal N(1)-acetyl-spermine/spermidine oxidase-like [Hydractinia symbiolongicarpus]XP_057296454.1 peroxisomal N(1)-acetyl-spermine/spermidine oxidase-like [Hydractinia symbiolongicarpus]
MNPKKKIDIVIIGAGISGLTCARELSKHSNEINLTILESTDRIGGRVKSIISKDGIALELGAEHIHGPKGNPVFNFAYEKGIVRDVSSRQGAFKDIRVLHCFHKDVLSRCTGDELYSALAEGTHLVYNFHDTIEEIKNENELDEYKSVGEVFSKVAQEKLVKFKDNVGSSKAFKSVLTSRMNAEAQHNGCENLFDLDLKLYTMFEHLEGDIQFKLPNGFSEIADSVAVDINPKCFRFNHEVIKIEHSQSLLKVTCANGEVFHAHNVVVTVSVEVLKRFVKHNVFSPSLPSKKVNSIQKLSLGQLEKIYFRFSNPLPKEVNLILFYPSTDKDVDKYSKVLGLQRFRESNWWMLWLTSHLLNKLKNSDPVSFLSELLTKLKHRYPSLPSTDFEHESVLVSDWTRNSNFGGTWGVLKTGTTERDVRNLAEPIFYNHLEYPTSLTFAGEMTHCSFYATTHAAFLSGVREAKFIVSRYNL